MSSDADNVTKLMENKEKWYGDAANFWESVDPTVNGMLQGYESISDIDAKGSFQFITSLKEDGYLPKCHKVADCGAGIGRISKHFLLLQFDLVDIVEPCKSFTDNIYSYMDDKELSSRIDTIYNEGLQTFTPKEGHYDAIWIQWVIGHLTDDDFVCFLKRCKKGLAPGGCIVIKDNVAPVTPVFDETDSSVTRPHRDYMAIFEKANMKLVMKQIQDGFPSYLFQVYMYALVPSDR